MNASRPLSLLQRLTLMIVLSATLVFSSLGWWMTQSIEDHFRDLDMQELNEVMQLVEMALRRMGSDPVKLQTPFKHILSAHSAADISLYQDNKALFSSSNFVQHLPQLKQRLTTAGTQMNTYQWHNRQGNYYSTLRRIALPQSDNSMLDTVVIVTVNSAVHQHFLNQFAERLWFMIIGATLLMGGLGWIAVHQGHRPLHAIVSRIQTISADALDERIDPKRVPLELYGLVIAFNGMLDRMESSFRRLSNFSTDIAHELRTPVTKLRTQTEVALGCDRDIETYREILYSNLEEYGHMARIIDDMLFIAKAENGLLPLRKEQISIMDELQELLDYYQLWAEDRQITLHAQGGGRVEGDRSILRRALSNLLANAIAHTDTGGEINIEVTSDDELQLSIDIGNSGEIAQHHLPRIFDRFYRVEMDARPDSEGVGLGLAIVKSIIEAHHGSIKVHSGEGSTHFIVTLKQKIG